MRITCPFLNILIILNILKYINSWAIEQIGRGLSKMSGILSRKTKFALLGIYIMEHNWICSFGKDFSEDFFI
jgi:hypothetical protein